MRVLSSIEGVKVAGHDAPLPLLEPVDALLVTVAAVTHAHSQVRIARHVLVVVRTVVTYKTRKIKKDGSTFHTSGNGGVF